MGSQENIAHKPMSIVPNIVAPLIKFVLTSGVSVAFADEDETLDDFQTSDSLTSHSDKIEMIKGKKPSIKASRQSETK